MTGEPFADPWDGDDVIEDEDTDAEPSLPDVVRQDLIDLLSADRRWAGDIGDVAFLKGLYDLEKLPSHDGRYKSALGDIKCHVGFGDWDDDWPFYDDRFKLRYGTTDEFLRFVDRTVHPRVQHSARAAQELVDDVNDVLAGSAYELTVDKTLKDGRAVYRATARSSFHGPRPALTAGRGIQLGDRKGLEAHLKRIQTGLVENDPELTIGSCKELIESICHQVLDETGSSPDLQERPRELPKLFRMATAALDAELVSNRPRASEGVRKVVQGMTTVVQGLAELRNDAGTGHGRSTASTVERMHAELALNAVVAISEFMFAIWSRCS
ncbi:abortive infection family protein [Nocardia rhamnosiphila]